MTATDSMQEYLAEAWRIAHYQPDERYVSTSALAEEIGVSAPAVTRMVQRLKQAGYLDHEPYRGIRLTPAGEVAALASIRRHRLVERFLVDVMGFGWHEVHDDADELGLVVSDALVDKMDAMSGYPKRCPHGEPIPSADLVMPRIIDYPLSDVAVRRDYVISRVHTHDEQKLRYISQLRLEPGARFRLISRAPFKGPLQLRVADRSRHVGHELASDLRVCSEAEYGLV
ncbi:MAG: metal-dependent transcriptional regulator [Chloroflexi bacterium]|nr:metal-dependent transcriptional regulator [Chloroflexota bacterium]MCY3582636.1 metal-dependent transcriptional regulator [Chloroflexota bacterium]MCY3715877.1 metal-dependent transcriptional regulator [Chloroflexota bacterium]MDE2649872.1 metal-dependent transcriptional regulator [Chloroflexota bacterium]MXV92059.1 metal-dependent transcriptional regulator [Chloroflexota bacterium]